jgi:hypothetical protein
LIPSVQIAARPEQSHGRGKRLKRRADAKGHPVFAGQIAHDADERRPEGERELVDPHHEADE